MVERKKARKGTARPVGSGAKRPEAAKEGARGTVRPSAPRKAPGGKKMKAYGSFDPYLADQPARSRHITRALREFVHRLAPALQESVKWATAAG